MPSRGRRVSPASSPGQVLYGTGMSQLTPGRAIEYTGGNRDVAYREHHTHKERVARAAQETSALKKRHGRNVIRRAFGKAQEWLVRSTPRLSPALEQRLSVFLPHSPHLASDP
jgi:hypothetical protein